MKLHITIIRNRIASGFPCKLNHHQTLDHMFIPLMFYDAVILVSIVLAQRTLHLINPRKYLKNAFKNLYRLNANKIKSP